MIPVRIRQEKNKANKSVQERDAKDRNTDRKFNNKAET